MHTPKQARKPGTTTQPVESGVDFQPVHPVGALREGPLQPGECLMIVVQSKVYERHVERRHVAMRRHLFQLT